MKPTRLDRVRDYVKALDGYDMPGTQEMLTDMTDEIEAWRKTFREYDAAISSPQLRRHAPVIYESMRALLPSKEAP